jgi:hypothetical protein
VECLEVFFLLLNGMGSILFRVILCICIVLERTQAFVFDVLGFEREFLKILMEGKVLNFGLSLV